MPPANTTEVALMAAVLAAPDDDLPRLVYADWCDEHGRPDRAEFIRTEIEMAKMMPDEDTPPEERDQPRFRPLQKRAYELWAAHSAEWYPELKEATEESSTHRGFPDYIATSVTKFIRYGQSLFTLAPTVTDVFLDKIGTKAAALGRCPALAHVERLSFSGAHFGWQEAEAFFRTEHLHRLRRFDIEFSEAMIAPEGALALSECPSLVRLEQLNLHGHGICPSGATAVLRQPRFHTLRELDLGGNWLTDEATAGVGGFHHLSGLRRLELGWNRLTSDGLRAVCLADPFTGLEVLGLQENHLTPAAADYLVSATFAGRLRDLRVWDSRLGSDGVARLLAGRNFTRLEDLNVSGNTLDVDGVRALASHHGFASLTTLTATNCDFSPAVARALAGVTTLPALRSLDVGQHPIGPPLISALLDGPLIRTLHSLALTKTSAGDDGAELLAAAELPHLRTLHLNGNGITDAGARALVNSKTLTGLRSVWIQDNKLTKKDKAMVQERFGEDGCWV